MIATNFVDLVIPDLDGGARGDRASQRAEDIAKANKWKLGNRAAQGSHVARSAQQPGTLRGKTHWPTAYNHQRNYANRGSRQEIHSPRERGRKKIQGLEVEKGSGTGGEWFIQDNVRRYYRTNDTPTVETLGQPQELPGLRQTGTPAMWPEPKQAHVLQLPAKPPNGKRHIWVRSLKEVREQQERDRQHLEKERERLIKEEGAGSQHTRRSWQR